MKLKEKPLAKELAKIAKKALNPALDALDIAFWTNGSNAAEMNVSFSIISHALSTHQISNEIDFFTALDDRPTVAGSAHMGTLEFNSATYYPTSALTWTIVTDTQKPPEDLAQAVSNFTKALFVATPIARQTTQSGASPWEFAKVLMQRTAFAGSL